MSRTARRSLAAFAWVIGAVGALMVAPSASGQQQNRTAPPQAQPTPLAAPVPSGNADIKILKVGIAPPPKSRTPQPPGNPPVDLNAVDFTAAAKVIFGDVPDKPLHATLTVRRGYVAGQASMAFGNPGLVNYGHHPDGYAADGSLRVDLDAKANRSYMLDLLFTPYFSAPCEFTITLPDSTKQTASCPASGHLIFGFQSTVSGTQSILLENGAWFFYKIAISTLSDGPQSSDKKAPLPPNVTAPARATSSAVIPGDIRIFRSSNARPGAPHAPTPPGDSSAELSPAAFAAAAAAVFGNVTSTTLKKVTLSARHGYAFGQGYQGYLSGTFHSLDYWSNTISVAGSSLNPPALTIWADVVADKTYMVDVLYEVQPSDAAKCSFSVYGGQGVVSQQLPCSKPGLQHLLVGLYAPFTGQAYLDFKGNVPWTFHQATITRQ